MAQWGKALVAKADDPENLEFDPWGPHGGKRELIPESCPLTSTCITLGHMYATFDLA